MEDKVIEILIEAITNQYFIYTVIVVAVLAVFKSIKGYRLYKKDCAVLNQKPKPIGFVQNTIIDISALSILVSFAFTGYTVYTHPEIFSTEKNYKLEKSYTPKASTSISAKYEIDAVVMQNRPVVKNTEKHRIMVKPQGEKPIVDKMSAKEKLKRELEQAIKDVE